MYKYHSIFISVHVAGIHCTGSINHYVGHGYCSCICTENRCLGWIRTFRNSCGFLHKVLGFIPSKKLAINLLLKSISIYTLQKPALHINFIYMVCTSTIICYFLLFSVCYSCKQKTQLTVAAVLSTIYAGLMVVVMVGIIQTFVTNNILDPSLFFIEVVAGKSKKFCVSNSNQLYACNKHIANFNHAYDILWSLCIFWIRYL